MGERKVLNKYYPPDFDPSKLPRRKNPKAHQMKIRTMLPMSIRCTTCGNFIYKGTKFNSRTEEVAADKYLGEIKVLRFYIKCSDCAAEITFKTDPQNDDYVVESGATRNFDGFEDESEASEKKRKRVDAEDCGEANRAAKCSENKREMETYAALSETLHLKSMHEKAGSELALQSFKSRDAEKKRKEEEEDEALVKTIVFRNSKNYVRRIGDDEEEDWS